MAGEVGFFELGVDDPERGRRYYEALFGWRFEPGPAGGGFAIQGSSIAGGLHGGDAGAAPYVFFTVEDMNNRDGLFEIANSFDVAERDARHTDRAQSSGAERLESEPLDQLERFATDADGVGVARVDGQAGCVGDERIRLCR